MWRDAETYRRILPRRRSPLDRFGARRSGGWSALGPDRRPQSCPDANRLRPRCGGLVPPCRNRHDPGHALRFGSSRFHRPSGERHRARAGQPAAHPRQPRPPRRPHRRRRRIACSRPPAPTVVGSPPTCSSCCSSPRPPTATASRSRKPSAAHWPARPTRSARAAITSWSQRRPRSHRGRPGDPVCDGAGSGAGLLPITLTRWRPSRPPR